MAIRLVCPSCDCSLLAPDGAEGRRADCPMCGASLRVPAPPAGPAEWYYRGLLEEEGGPVTFAELAEMARRVEVGPYTRVCRGAGAEFVLAHRVEGLFRKD